MTVRDYATPVSQTPPPALRSVDLIVGQASSLSYNEVKRAWSFKP